MLTMGGIGVLFTLLLISSITAIAVFIWFRLARFPFSLIRFSVALLVGAASCFPALFFQYLLAVRTGIFPMAGRWGPVAEIFIRIAFTEELSRFLLLSVMFFIIRRHNSLTMEGATGLIAGLGFAILESAVLGASSPHNSLLRAFTTAPLHGACGFRVGSSIETIRENPARGILRFLSAVVIHGVYNFMLRIPGTLPSIAAVFIALSAFVTAILAVRNGLLSLHHSQAQ